MQKGVRSPQQQEKTSSSRRPQKPGASGGPSRTAAKHSRGRAQLHPIRHEHPHIGHDISQPALITFSRSLPDHPAQQQVSQRTRQDLAHRLGGQRARQGHLVVRPHHANGGRRDQQVPSRSKRVY